MNSRRKLNFAPFFALNAQIFQKNQILKRESKVVLTIVNRYYIMSK